MTPDTQAAIDAGRPLTRRQFREYIDHEAKAAGFRDGDEVILRTQNGVLANSPREMSLRLSVNTYLKA